MRVEEVARNGSNTTTVEGVNDDETVIPGDEMDEGRERVLGENDHGHFGESGRGGSYSHTHFRVYKRRWFGLAQLVLLNVVVSWDVSISFFLFDICLSPMELQSFEE